MGSWRWLLAINQAASPLPLSLKPLIGPSFPPRRLRLKSLSIVELLFSVFSVRCFRLTG